MGSFYIEAPGLQNPEELKKKLDELLDMPVHSAEELKAVLLKQSSFFDKVEELLTGHYIQFQRNNSDQKAKEQFEHDQETLLPILKDYEAKLDEAFYNSPYREKLDASFGLFSKSKRNAIELFRRENIPLEVEEDRLNTRYFEITGGMTVTWDGKEKTLSQMQMFLQNPDRTIRETAWKAIQQEMLSYKDDLQEIMDRLIEIRQEKARNAGLDNYRDYMFKKYERYSYTPEDCYELASAVREHVVPLKEKLDHAHREKLGVDTYRPWDTEAVLPGEQPLKPVDSTDQLVSGSIMIFKQLDPAFAHLVETMSAEGLLDLDSRKNKSPGGFCSELPLTGLSFIFMNAANTHDDVVTFLHEMGHCIHNDMKKDIELNKYRETPMESSELASMAMELFTMDYWDMFYSTEEELKRAKREQLEGIIRFLPWGVTIDQFQHWMYENPDHSTDERNSKFFELAGSLSASAVNWAGYEEELRNRWLRQLHIFEVPFYYIEYVIAQLGAVQLYRLFKEDKAAALAGYRKALSLGNSVSLQEVYEAAGIRFDFTAGMVKDLMAFMQEELAALS
ncbi:M3 family oligoendopeptidase [Bacillus marinisedimentorum]|uniref:M3 family oligoendopeptidase n=1 Tax=Bacillus marinisedimentorum TaxID=1821260 RepID=UPI00087334F8|nr:M3 family oligoendopeptidase [Bacillus marinisedimentorum]